MHAWHKLRDFPTHQPLVNPSILDTLDLTGPLAVRSLTKHEIDPCIHDWLSDHGTRCARGLVFWRSGPPATAVHRDMRRNDDGSTHPAFAAINLQVQGVGVMNFYDMPAQQKDVFDTNARTAFQAWPDDSTLTLADRLLFDSTATLVRVDVPHRVDHMSLSRLAISIRFAPKGQ